MVDIIASTFAVHHVQQIVEGCIYIFYSNSMSFFRNTGGEHQIQLLITETDFNATQALFIINTACFDLIQLYIRDFSTLCNDNFAGFFIHDRFS